MALYLDVASPTGTFRLKLRPGELCLGRARDCDIFVRDPLVSSRHAVFTLGGDGALTVKDLEASVRWYTAVLGFAEDRRHERGGQLIAVSLRAGAVRLLLSRDDGAKGPDRVKGDGISLQLTTPQDVDAVAARIKERGGMLETEPFTMPHARAFRLRDPDGFRFTISSPPSA